MTANDLVTLIETKILLPNAIARQEEVISMTHKDYRAEPEAELVALKARWDVEAPVREARAKLAAAGWSKSTYDPALWAKKVGANWAKRPLLAVVTEVFAAELESPENDPPAVKAAVERLRAALEGLTPEQVKRSLFIVTEPR